MRYTLYQLLWFFVLYSFAGWFLGVVIAAFKNKQFVNTGFLNAPLCPVYGVGAVACTVFLRELYERPFFLFVGGMIISAAITFITGFLLERIFHLRWWDFTKHRFQFEGYISVPYAAVCGLAAFTCVRFLNPLLASALHIISPGLGKIVLIIILALLVVDSAGSFAAVLELRFRVKHIVDVTEEVAGSLMEQVTDNVAENLQRLSDNVGNAITGRIQRRMAHAYPSLEARHLLEAKHLLDVKQREEVKSADVFAKGCCFYKLVALFFIGAFLGDVVETIFCYATAGIWMSRSSVVYGPFSIVWGLGCVLLTAILYKYRGKNDRYIFAFGTVLGGAYEYLCSVFTELVFGTVFWDYSEIPFNLGGRINLLYCFFWGVAAVVWLKGVYPFLSDLIEKIPKKAGTIGIWCLIVFMIFNMAISSLAMVRYSVRQTANIPSSNAMEEFLDSRFPDSRIEQVYPNVKIVEQELKTEEKIEEKTGVKR